MATTPLASSREDFFASNDRFSVDGNGFTPSLWTRPFMQAMAPYLNAARLGTMVIGLAAGVHGSMDQPPVAVLDQSPSAIEHILRHDGPDPGPKPDPEATPQGGPSAAEHVPHTPDAGPQASLADAFGGKLEDGTPVVVIDNDALGLLGIRIGDCTPDDVQRLIAASGVDALVNEDYAQRIADNINQQSGWSMRLVEGEFAVGGATAVPGGQLSIVVAPVDMSQSPAHALSALYGIKIDPTEIRTSLTMDDIRSAIVGHESHHGNDRDLDYERADPLLERKPENLDELRTQVAYRLANEQTAELGGALHRVFETGNIGVLKSLADVRAIYAYQQGAKIAAGMEDPYDVNGYTGVFYNLAPCLDQLHAHLASLPDDQLRQLRDIDRALSGHAPLSEEQQRAVSTIVHPGTAFEDLDPAQRRALQSMSAAAFEDAVTKPFRVAVHHDGPGQFRFDGFHGDDAVRLIAADDFAPFFGHGGLIERARQAEASLLTPTDGPTRMDALPDVVTTLNNAVETFGRSNALAMKKAGFDFTPDAYRGFLKANEVLGFNQAIDLMKQGWRPALDTVPTPQAAADGGPPAAEPPVIPQSARPSPELAVQTPSTLPPAPEATADEPPPVTAGNALARATAQIRADNPERLAAFKSASARGLYDTGWLAEDLRDRVQSVRIDRDGAAVVALRDGTALRDDGRSVTVHGRFDSRFAHALARGVANLGWRDVDIGGPIRFKDFFAARLYAQDVTVGNHEIPDDLLPQADAERRVERFLKRAATDPAGAAHERMLSAVERLEVKLSELTPRRPTDPIDIAHDLTLAENKARAALEAAEKRLAEHRDRSGWLRRTFSRPWREQDSACAQSLERCRTAYDTERKKRGDVEPVALRNRLANERDLSALEPLRQRLGDAKAALAAVEARDSATIHAVLAGDLRGAVKAGRAFERSLAAETTGSALAAAPEAVGGLRR